MVFGLCGYGLLKKINIMNKITGNEPAFPADAQNPETNDIFYYGGLTIRQYYAGLLMAAIVQNPNHIGGYLSAAAEAVKHSDALIAELNK